MRAAGFKSFADPITLNFTRDLTGIVGPNGCGKSNVVDAIRCVLSGAARHLRGDSMPDVIFNGSAKRKPVGRAFVELIFDNSDGMMGGEYAQYADITVRREISRDGSSDYFLNSTRCRKKDVIDLFLGTGLGPQSYAIIEQGMISRLIEAKPEELRVYLEEAAGISKYRERRKETENRLQHTKENLDRLNDHLLELEKQLNHLHKQAQSAEKYKTYQQELILLKSENEFIHWRDLDGQIQLHHQTIQKQENEFESYMTQIRDSDVRIEKARQEKAEASDHQNEIQSHFYTENTEITRLEQNLKNLKERRLQLEADLKQLEKSHQEIQDNCDSDQLQIEELDQETIQIEPTLNQAREDNQQLQQALESAEQNVSHWQNQWDQFNQKNHKVSQSIQVESTHTQHLRNSLESINQRLTRINDEKKQLNYLTIDEDCIKLSNQSEAIKEELEKLQTRLKEVQSNWQTLHQSETQVSQEINQLRQSLQQMTGRYASLEALQQAALGKNDQSLKQWLNKHQLDNKPRLAENLRVNPGFEIAVETVLGDYLESVCVEEIINFVDSSESLSQGQITLIKNRNANNTDSNVVSMEGLHPLSAEVQSHSELSNLLNTIFVAENLSQALTLLPKLTAEQSIITKNGVWLAQSWLRIGKSKDTKSGVIQRERELKELAEQIASKKEEVEQKEKLLAQTKNEIIQLQNERDQTQQKLLTQTKLLSTLQAEYNSKQNQIQQIKRRAEILEKESTENNQLILQTKEKLSLSENNLTEAKKELESLESERKHLLEQKEIYRQKLEKSRFDVRENKNLCDELQMRLESCRSQSQFIRQNILRAQKQLKELSERRENLQITYDNLVSPLEELQNKLNIGLESRLKIQETLEIARQKLNGIEHSLNEEEKKHRQLNDSLNTCRSQLEQSRMGLQALQIKQSHHADKINELGLPLEELAQKLPAEANVQEWEEKISKIETRIQRLGSINLAAIEEHQVLLERKTYLDTQTQDLLQAIDMLEEAIRKIDKESRAKLKETYDKVNSEFSRLFQQVFHGGQAELQMTEDDFLTAGIIVKAQPPGKRNTTIHLLSGGEKALTAISLVFALFQLNPSPFCILDEVDAPLDDLNVGRFCNLVKEMSSKVQFIFISHNKLTIEIAEQLIGVTMSEPGVSRLVSVDIQEAIALASA